MIWRATIIIVLVLAVGACALVEDRPSQMASSPSTSTPGDGASGASAGGRPEQSLEPGEAGNPNTTTGAPGGSSTGGPPGSVPVEGGADPTSPTGPNVPADPGSPTLPGAPPLGLDPAPPVTTVQWPPLCFHLRRFLDTSVEMFSVSTTPEVVTRLQSLRSILSSIESTGGAEIGADARVVADGLDQLVGRLDRSVGVPETHRAILFAAGGVAPASDRLISRSLGLCGGSDNPVLSTQDGIKSLTGIQ